MYLREINPFLRYVRASNFIPLKHPACAVDYHFYYIICGSGRMHVDDAWHGFESGTVIILPPGSVYDFEMGDGVDVVSINFDYSQTHCHIKQVFPPRLVERFDARQIIEKHHFEDCEHLNFPLFVGDMTYLAGNIMEVVEEYNQRKQLYRETSSALFRCILMETVRHALWSERGNDSIKLILEYIHRHFGEDITNDTLAGIIGYHSYHVNRLMKLFTGKTLHRYVIDYRMEKAKQYLRENSLPVGEIAELCGCRNLNNFSESFKKKVGMSPLVYRRETQQRL